LLEFNQNFLILGIDASNIRSGGGLTHLIELLNNYNPETYGFNQIILCAYKGTLDQLPNQSWLVKILIPSNEKNLLKRIAWQRFKMIKVFNYEKCDLIFSPGGIINSLKIPVVTMSRNMLPFEWKELKRFGISFKTIRYMILYFVQMKSFQMTNGIVFLSEYAKNKILPHLKSNKNYTIIRHGINKRFFSRPRTQFALDHYTFNKPFCFTYISIINFYKHQWNVVSAIHRLRRDGIPISLKIIGPKYAPAFKKLKKTIKNLDPNNQFIEYVGEVPYTKLVPFYHDADAFIFASSCENLPNILLEAMASGLPIISSDRGPMPEVLKDAGLYFDPENIESIVQSMKELVSSTKLRTSKALLAYDYSLEYTWEQCASETFLFLNKIALQQSKQGSI